MKLTNPYFFRSFITHEDRRNVCFLLTFQKLLRVALQYQQLAPSVLVGTFCQVLLTCACPFYLNVPQPDAPPLRVSHPYLPSGLSSMWLLNSSLTIKDGGAQSVLWPGPYPVQHWAHVFPSFPLVTCPFCPSYPMPDLAPGGHWLLYNHPWTLRQCLFIPPGWLDSAFISPVFLFTVEFCQGLIVPPCRPHVTFAWLPAGVNRLLSSSELENELSCTPFSGRPYPMRFFRVNLWTG